MSGKKAKKAKKAKKEHIVTSSSGSSGQRSPAPDQGGGSSEPTGASLAATTSAPTATTTTTTTTTTSTQDTLKLKERLTATQAASAELREKNKKEVTGESGSDSGSGSGSGSDSGSDSGAEGETASLDETEEKERNQSLHGGLNDKSVVDVEAEEPQRKEAEERQRKEAEERQREGEQAREQQGSSDPKRESSFDEESDEKQGGPVDTDLPLREGVKRRRNSASELGGGETSPRVGGLRSEPRFRLPEFEWKSALATTTVLWMVLLAGAAFAITGVVLWAGLAFLPTLLTSLAIGGGFALATMVFSGVWNKVRKRDLGVLPELQEGAVAIRGLGDAPEGINPDAAVRLEFQALDHGEPDPGGENPLYPQKNLSFWEQRTLSAAANPKRYTLIGALGVGFFLAAGLALITLAVLSGVGFAALPAALLGLKATIGLAVGGGASLVIPTSLIGLMVIDRAPKGHYPEDAFNYRGIPAAPVDDQPEETPLLSRDEHQRAAPAAAEGLVGTTWSVTNAFEELLQTQYGVQVKTEPATRDKILRRRESSHSHTL